MISARDRDARRAAIDDTPIAGPWLSPQVVKRNIWPKVLKDMGALGDRGVLGGRWQVIEPVPSERLAKLRAFERSRQIDAERERQ